MNLWTITPQPTTSPQASSLGGDVLQQIFDQAAKLQVTLRMLRQSDVVRYFSPQLLGDNAPALEKLLDDLMTKLRQPRYMGGPRAEARQAPVPDEKWAKALQKVADGNLPVMPTEAAQLVGHAMRITRESAEKLQQFYDAGKAHGWPLPLLSMLKTVIARADAFTDLTVLRERLKELEAEIAELRTTVTALGSF